MDIFKSQLISLESNNVCKKWHCHGLIHLFYSVINQVLKAHIISVHDTVFELRMPIYYCIIFC